jgi:hypothetical protein
MLLLILLIIPGVMLWLLLIESDLTSTVQYSLISRHHVVTAAHYIWFNKYTYSIHSFPGAMLWLLLIESVLNKYCTIFTPFRPVHTPCCCYCEMHFVQQFQYDMRRCCNLLQNCVNISQIFAKVRNFGKILYFSQRKDVAVSLTTTDFYYLSLYSIVRIPAVPDTVNELPTRIMHASRFILHRDCIHQHVAHT